MIDRRSVLFLTLSLLLAAGAYAADDEVEVIKPPKVPPADDEKKPDLSRVVKQIVQKTNAFRKDEGRAPVEANATLTKTAEAFARYMARTDRYGHTADGSKHTERAKKQGYDYCVVLENIAYQYESDGFTSEQLAKGYFEGWKKSPGHRKNMLDPDVTETGVAVARSAKTGYYYAVQMFGRPKSQAYKFAVVNRSRATVSYKVDGKDYTVSRNSTRTHTHCRQPEVSFAAAGGEEKKIKPQAGERLLVTAGKGGVQVTTQKAPGKKP